VFVTCTLALKNAMVVFFVSPRYHESITGLPHPFRTNSTLNPLRQSLVQPRSKYSASFKKGVVRVSQTRAAVAFHCTIDFLYTVFDFKARASAKSMSHEHIPAVLVCKIRQRSVECGIKNKGGQCFWDGNIITWMVG
jgi:hypothetical protein